MSNNGQCQKFYASNITLRQMYRVWQPHQASEIIH